MNWAHGIFAEEAFRWMGGQPYEVTTGPIRSLLPKIFKSKIYHTGVW